jgi:hypothetical protein
LIGHIHLQQGLTDFTRAGCCREGAGA